jgi:hypothetical protein
VELALLPTLTDGDLLTLGVTQPGARRAMLTAAAAMLPPVFPAPPYSCPHSQPRQGLMHHSQQQLPAASVTSGALGGREACSAPQQAGSRARPSASATSGGSASSGQGRKQPGGGSAASGSQSRKAGGCGARQTLAALAAQRQQRADQPDATQHEGGSQGSGWPALSLPVGVRQVASGEHIASSPRLITFEP